MDGGNKGGGFAVLPPMLTGPARFPHLALPFTIVGASAGWLSAQVLAITLIVRMKSAPALAVAAIAAVVAGLTGAVITRMCRGDHERYQIDDGTGAPRATLDRWVNHAGAVLAAGAITGGLSAGLFDAYHGVVLGAFGGLACAAAFVPVCLAVVRAARRAQRARMGSLVAGSDRRAVWGILAITLSVATLWGFPIWAQAGAGYQVSTWPVAVMVAGAGVTIALALAGDAAALVRAKRALARDLQAKDAAEVGAADTRVPRVDLGLGSDVSAEVARPTSAYRGRDRTVALVVGSPKLAVSALRWALVRGAVGLATVAGIAAVHSFARSKEVQLAFDERRCEDSEYAACQRVADAVVKDQPARALLLYETACGRSAPTSCTAAARIYEKWAENEEGRSPIWREPPTAARKQATNMYERACKYGDALACSKVTVSKVDSPP